MVPLEKDGPFITDLDGGGQNSRGVFLGPLTGVVDFRAGDLEDNRTGTQVFGHPEDGLSRIVGQGPDIDGRHGKTSHLPPAHGLIESLDRCGAGPQRCRNPAQKPAGGRPDALVRAEDRRTDPFVRQCLPDPPGVEDPHIRSRYRQDPFEALLEGCYRFVDRHDRPSRISRAMSTSVRLPM
jgi:hypothetical protein